MENNQAQGLSANQKYCIGCAKPLHVSAKTCPSCGAEQSHHAYSSRSTVNAKSRTAAILLALFLGGIGGHKFYLGQVGMGILYLLFCWTFIPSFVALIELIIYITMSDETFAEKYG